MTESRLISKEITTTLIEYDHTKYEEQMFYFNTVTRPALYQHDVQGEGIDHCYDCRAEVHILSSYLAKYRGVPSTGVSKYRGVPWINGVPAHEDRSRQILEN